LPGHYRFTISAPGFKTENRSGIELQTADNKQIDIQLEIGSAAQSVDVTAAAPLLQTASGEVSLNMEEKKISTLPLDGRNFIPLVTLSPGVAAQYQNNNVAHLWSFNAASQFEANGGRNNIYSNNYLLDGMPETSIVPASVPFVPEISYYADPRMTRTDRSGWILSTVVIHDPYEKIWPV